MSALACKATDILLVLATTCYHDILPGPRLCCAVESKYFGSVIPMECLLLPSEIRKRVVNRPCKIFLFLVLSGNIGDLSISSFDFLGLEV